MFLGADCLILCRMSSINCLSIILLHNSVGKRAGPCVFPYCFLAKYLKTLGFEGAGGFQLIAPNSRFQLKLEEEEEEEEEEFAAWKGVNLQSRPIVPDPQNPKHAP